jgi:predicted MPP superfamily phosphohydrolase
MLPPFRILHISDPHFGEQSHYGELGPDSAQALRLVLEIGMALRKAGLIASDAARPPKRLEPHFDAAILSGDLTWQGKTNGFKLAADFVKLLEKHNYCARHSILLIPGNHDMSFVRGGKKLWLGEDVELPYREFLADVGHKSFGFLARVKEFRSTGIVLAGLNSARIIRDDSDELGFVGYDQFFGVMSYIWSRRSKPLKERNELLIGFLHHHLIQMDPATPRGYIPRRGMRRYSITLDAPQIMAGMRQAKVQLVLHGHQHMQWCALDRSGKPDKSGGAWPEPLPIWAAGSAGIRYPDSRDEHHFQVVDVAEDLCSLTVHHFSADARVTSVPRVWRHVTMDPIKLTPEPLRRPDELVYREMDGDSRAWASSFERQQRNWKVMSLLDGGERGMNELRAFLFAAWEEGNARGVLPFHLRDRAAFEQSLDVVLRRLRIDPSLLQDYERLVGTGNELAMDQWILRLVDNHSSAA